MDHNGNSEFTNSKSEMIWNSRNRRDLISDSPTQAVHISARISLLQLASDWNSSSSNINCKAELCASVADVPFFRVAIFIDLFQGLVFWT